MSKIPVKVLNQAVLQFGEDSNCLNVTFHKTLRIPEDGKVYPLPPSFGIFRIEKVDDYIDSPYLPESWKKTGGVFITMFQREAMWMQFNTFNKNGKRPKALKIGMGKINSITGKPWKEELNKKDQDYVVVPDQKWLDGCNSGNNFISQFVAMKFGSGTSVEEQVTGEEKVGGIQLLMYDSKYIMQEKKNKPKPKPKPIPYPPIYKPTYPPYHPIYKPQPPVTVMNYPPSNGYDYYGGYQGYYNSQSGYSNNPYAPQYNQYNAPPRKFGRGGLALRSRRVCEKKKSKKKGFFGGFSKKMEDFSSSSKIQMESAPKYSQNSFSNNFDDSDGEEERMESLDRIETGAKEMNLSAGGKMKQKIVKDPYGYETWQQGKNARIFIHICNSVMYEQITGKKAPKSSITKSVYKSYNYPWFDLYDEHVESVKKSKILSKIQTVGEITNTKDKTIHIDNVNMISNPKTKVTKKILVPEPIKVNPVKTIEVKPVKPVEVTPVDNTNTNKTISEEEVEKKNLLLVKMGFDNQQLNKFLLRKHVGEFKKVVQLLIEFQDLK